MKRSSLTLAVLAFVLCGSTRARSEFVITISQQDTDVVASGSGSFNLAGLKFDSTGLRASAGGHGILFPFVGLIDIGTGNAVNDFLDAYTGFTGPLSFGGIVEAEANSSQGPIVSITNQATIIPLLQVPQGYKSGTTLTNSSTWSGKTLSDLGLSPGTFVWTWGSPTNASADDLRLVITTATPEPPSLILLGLGSLGLMGFGFRRRGRVTA